MASLVDDISRALAQPSVPFNSFSPIPASGEDALTSDISVALGGTPLGARRESSFLDDVGLFLKSTVQAGTTDIVGIDPSRDVARFRAENPGLDIASTLLGSIPFFVIPALLPARALSAIPVAGRLAGAGAKLTAAGRPALGAAATEAARFLPFEAARVGIATGVGATEGEGLEKFADVGSAALFDLVAIPLTAAVFTKLFRSTPGPRGVESAERKLQDAFALDTNVPLQKRLDNVLKLRGTPEVRASAETVGLFERAATDLKLQIRNETPVRGQTFVAKLQRGKVSEELNQLFREDTSLRSRKTFTVKRAVQTAGPQGFETIAARDAAIAALPVDWERNTQFLRILTAKDAQGAGKIEGVFKRKLKKFGGVYYGKEAGDGGYVMVRKVGGKVGKSAAKDKFLLFKTDNPELFAPEGFAEAKASLNRFAFNPVEDKVAAELRQQVPIAKEVSEFAAFGTEAAIVGSPKDGRGALIRAGQKAFKVLPEETQKAIEDVGKELGFAGQAAGRWLKDHLAPAIAQFSRNPRALRTFQIAQKSFEFANQRALKILHGEIKLAGGENPLASLSIPSRVLKRSKGGLVEEAEGLTEESLAELTAAFNQALSLDDAVAKGFSKPAMDMLKQLKTHDDAFINDARGLATLAGSIPPTAREGHYMMTRTWVGDWRLRLTREDGGLVNMAAARDRRGVLEIARGMQEAAARQDGTVLKFDPAEIFRVDKFGDDIQLIGALNLEDPVFKATQEARAAFRPTKVSGRPQFLKPRTGVGGFLGEAQALTKQELVEQLTRQINGRQKFLAERTLDSDPIFQRQLQLLADEDPDLYRSVLARVGDLKGTPGPIVASIERVLDVPLAPFLGKGGARKITAAVNATEFNLTLGMGDLGFPLINAATFMQTVLPEASFVLNATPEMLAKYYVLQPLRGAGASARGSMGVLDMSKLLRQSFREVVSMGDDKLLAENVAWGIDAGIISPKFVEEFGGATSRKALAFKKVLAGEESMSNFIVAASQFLPALSEDLARGHAFTLGHIVGRDFLGAEGRQLREFTRQFVNRTMFGYGTVDRPRWMSGAVGGTLGLFKNWSSHYIANMALYGGEALTRRNWGPMLWMMAGTGAIAGAGGVPLIGMADSASQIMSNKTLMENTYEAFGMRNTTAIADGMWYGLPGFLGVSLQGRAGAPGADIARDTGFLFSAAIANRAKNAVTAFGSVIDNWQATGKHPMTNQRIRTQFARAFGPRTLYRAMQSTEKRAIVSAQSGNKLLSNVNFAEKLGFTFGISSLKIDKAFEAHQQLWDEQKQMSETVGDLGTALSEAEEKRDWSTVDRIWFEAGLLGITDRVVRSAKVRTGNSNQDLFERQFKGFQADARLRVFGVR